MNTSDIIGAIAGSIALITAIIGLLTEISKRRRKHEEIVKSIKRKYLSEPIEILSRTKNRIRIDSDFLLWEKCTIVLWVYVQPQGEGLRNSPDHRYLIAHNTGEIKVEGEKWPRYFNQFALRHASTRGKWELKFSNAKAPPEYYPNGLIIGDGLLEGWHQFVISWNHDKPKIMLFIDGGKSGQDLSTSYLPYWPKEIDQNITIGAWTNDYSGHYCETRLAHIWIVDEFLEEDNIVIKEHLKLKP